MNQLLASINWSSAITGALLALMGAIAFWFVKDKAQLFRNVVLWGQLTRGHLYLPQLDADKSHNRRTASWATVVLRVKAWNDRVVNTRITVDEVNISCSIHPEVPFELKRFDKTTEVLLPQLESGDYVITVSGESISSIWVSVKSIISENAKCKGVSVGQDHFAASRGWRRVKVVWAVAMAVFVVGIGRYLLFGT